MSVTTNRPPPRILFVHDGAPAQQHIDYLTNAGFTVAHPNHCVGCVGWGLRLAGGVGLGEWCGREDLNLHCLAATSS